MFSNLFAGVHKKSRLLHQLVVFSDFEIAEVRLSGKLKGCNETKRKLRRKLKKLNEKSEQNETKNLKLNRNETKKN
ncbi:hypothetical protein HanRHA438_Chr00c35g0855731 [Helianthus annuus]|nr:hypothetical protein HanRHA438_Chr00c35g0855731 [Helianthus annuus]